MALSKLTRDRLRAAFPNNSGRTVENAPVGMVYSDRVPVRGSVHISTGRVISRTEINKRFDKAFPK